MVFEGSKLGRKGFIFVNAGSLHAWVVGNDFIDR